ncbi:MAG TPA: 4a-hydroxytetrahydrobiopterin dehydratase [Candidatus Dormibacteraeota bacterium]|nr:4a-hydroxytetrahydrobiopterin dehydratase [Candidatus Dormibacteraeota bacterium]
MAAPLAERRCEVCTPDTPTLSRPEADGLLGDLQGWNIQEARGHLELTKTFELKGFMPGVGLVNQIAEIAEREGHHPDLLLKYGALTVTLWTHAAGGLTDNDFILAAKIDQVAQAGPRFTLS